MHNNALFDINCDVSNNFDICFYHFNDQIKLKVVETQLSSKVVAGLRSAAISGTCRSRTPLAFRTVSWRPWYDPAACMMR